MSGEAVIFLHTPLVQLEAKGGAHVLKLKGKILDEENEGVTIQVKGTGSEKGWFESDLVGEKIFIPMHKVDYIVLS